jgi:hypothetical protein
VWCLYLQNQHWTSSNSYIEKVWIFPKSRKLHNCWMKPLLSKWEYRSQTGCHHSWKLVILKHLLQLYYLFAQILSTEGYSSLWFGIHPPTTKQNMWSNDSVWDLSATSFGMTHLYFNIHNYSEE